MIRAASLAGLLVLAACQDNASQAAKPDPEARAACESSGGDYAEGGLTRQYFCFPPSPDAGQACKTSDDCTGFCRAETRTCTEIQPTFGCYDQVNPDGTTGVFCID